MKQENEGTLFKEQWKEKFREKSEQDWIKVCWREAENERFENKATSMLKC